MLCSILRPVETGEDGIDAGDPSSEFVFDAKNGNSLALSLLVLLLKVLLLYRSWRAGEPSSEFMVDEKNGENLALSLLVLLLNVLPLYRL